MSESLAVFCAELANLIHSQGQPMLAHLFRMAAMESQRLEIPLPSLGLSVIGLWDWDAVSDLNYLDEGGAQLFDVSPSEAAQGLPTSTYIRVIHPDDAPRVTDAIMQSLKHGGSFESRYRVVARSQVRHVLAKGFCTLNKRGQAERFSGVIMGFPDRVG